MNVRIFPDRSALAAAAGADAAVVIRSAIEQRGTARILVGTGRSQLEVFDVLAQQPGVAWSEVELFHVNEFIGLAIDHPGSTRRILFERLIAKTRIGRYHLLDGVNDPERVCRLEGAQLAAGRIDLAFTGIGANGRVACNEPPADFQAETPFLIVQLDEAWRRQRVGEAGFPTVADVPDRAISISLRQFLRAETVMGVAAGPRKAAAVKRCVEGAVSPLAPSSILQTHSNATVYLDREAAALLSSRREGG